MLRNQIADLLFGLTEFLLQSSQQFLFLALGEQQIIVCQGSEILLELSCDLIPVSFNLELVHIIPHEVSNSDAVNNAEALSVSLKAAIGFTPTVLLRMCQMLLKDSSKMEAINGVSNR